MPRLLADAVHEEDVVVDPERDQEDEREDGKAGVEARLVHIASDFMAACLPEMTGSLLGDKATSVVFDNSSATHCCAAVTPVVRISVDALTCAIQAIPTIVLPAPHGRTTTPLPPLSEPAAWNASAAAA